jgi:hypothetical protein
MRWVVRIIYALEEHLLVVYSQKIKPLSDSSGYGSHY